MSTLTPFTGGKATETPEEAGPAKQTYIFEVVDKKGDRAPDIKAFGLLSYGHAFVSVIEDVNTPICMIPYELILSIRTERSA